MLSWLQGLRNLWNGTPPADPTAPATRTPTPSSPQNIDSQGEGAREQRRLERQQAADAKTAYQELAYPSPDQNYQNLIREVLPASPDQNNDYQTTRNNTALSSSKEDVLALISNSIKRNPLDQYNNYTYHVKMWITTELNSETITNTDKQSIDNIPKVIIAESGVTAGFNIREFSFRNLTGSTSLTRNMPSFGWNMTITEPLGFSLPDRINSAAQVYGIKNWRLAKYFIEVWFTGYNEDGSPVATGLFHKVYRVTIVDIALGGTESGATYELKGLYDGQHGLENTVAMRNEVMVVGANTVGEFFTKLADQMNQGAINEALRSTAPLTKYQFQLPEKMKSWNINPGKILANDQYALNMTPKRDGNTVKLTIPSGTDVGQMIYYVLSLTNEAEAWMLGTDDPQNTVSNSIRKNPKIHSKMEYVGFDTLAGDYVKKITYTIIPYEEVRVRDDIPSVRAAEKPATQIEKIKYLVRNGRIAKKYEWIYTGQNLDILRFDFKINNFFTISTPAYNGFNTTSNTVQGAIADENTASWALHDRRYQTARRTAEQLKNKKTELENTINEKSKVGVLAGYGYSQKAEAQADIQVAKTALAQIENRIAINNALLEREKARIRQQDFFVDFANPLESAVRSNELVKYLLAGNALLKKSFAEQGAIYAEDQNILAVDTSLPFINTVKPNKEANSSNTNQAAASAKAPDTSRDPINIPTSRTLFGAAVGNFDSINKEMMNITMDIRGDPYWMGHGNVEQNAAVPDRLQTLSRDAAEYLNGDNMFYLKFRSGQIHNEETGFMEFTSDNQVVDGFYSVVEVTNTFRDGQFIQTLKSFKDTQSQHANPLMDSIMARKKAPNSNAQSVTSSPPHAVLPSDLSGLGQGQGADYYGIAGQQNP